VRERTELFLRAAPLRVNVREDELRLRGSGMPRPNDLFDCSRKQHVVRIEKHHNGAVARAKAGVKGRRVSAVGFEHADYPIDIPGDNLARVVHRTVIDNDHLNLRIGLRERTVDRRGEKARVVEVIDDNADQRRRVVAILDRIHRIQGGRG